jgi:agmatinase
MKNFMALPEEYSSKKSRFSIIPIAYGGNASWMKGAEKGPAAIISASENLEYYDEQFEIEPFVSGIETQEQIKPGKIKEEPASGIIEKILKKRISKNKFPIFLGGDHSVTIAATRAMESICSDFSFVSIDAHSDLRESWNSSRFNHACTTKRVLERHNALIVGLRSQDIDEAEFMKFNKDVSAIKKYDFSKDILKKMLASLSENVYLSIDVDAFDSSFIRSTGTPEPGGFFWDEMISLIEEIFKKKNVIGADITEFAPMGEPYNYNSEAFSLAKLCYKIMSLSEKYKETEKARKKIKH